MRKINFLVVVPIFLSAILFSLSFISQSEANRRPRAIVAQEEPDATYSIYDRHSISELSSTQVNKKQKLSKIKYDTNVSSRGEGSGRPTGCPNLWCGCWLARHVFGENRRDLWIAKNWLKFKRSAPRIGAVAVMTRRGGGHVGVVVDFDERGNPIIQSGNHNRIVATAVYPKSRIIAYVSPQYNIRN